MSGAGGVPELDLGDLVRPRQGGVFRRKNADKATEAMRRRLARADFWQATVDIDETYVPASARLGLVFEVATGPRMSLEVRGASVPGGIESDVRRLLREGGTGRDVLEVGGERIESHLRSLGHREALVQVAIESRPGDRAVVVFDADPGPADRGGLGGASGGRRRSSRATEDEGRRSRSRTRCSPRTCAVSPGPSRTWATSRPRWRWTWPEEGGAQPVVFFARPGPRALVADVSIEGPPLPPGREDEGPQELAVRAGLPYRVRDVASAREALVSIWRRAGYLEARVDPEIVLSDDRDRGPVAVSSWSPAPARSWRASCWPACGRPGSRRWPGRSSSAPGSPSRSSGCSRASAGS